MGRGHRSSRATRRRAHRAGRSSSEPSTSSCSARRTVVRRPVLATPLSGHVQDTLVSLSVTERALLELVERGDVSFVVPQSIERYDHAFLAAVIERRPTAVVCAPTVCPVPPAGVAEDEPEDEEHATEATAATSATKSTRDERFIGRSCPFTFRNGSARGQDPRSNRACGFPAHGLPVASRGAAFMRPRDIGRSHVGDGARGCRRTRPSISCNRSRGVVAKVPYVITGDHT